MSDSDHGDSSSEGGFTDDSSIPDASDICGEADSQLHHWRVVQEEDRGLSLLCRLCEGALAPLFLMPGDSPQCLPCVWKVTLPRLMPLDSRGDWIVFLRSALIPLSKRYLYRIRDEGDPPVPP